MSSTSATMTMAIGSTTALDPSEPFMLPGMSSPQQQHLKLDPGNRVVRFDRECALIPESPKVKKTVLVTRSYSLPLWKKRGRSGQRQAQGVLNETGDGVEHAVSTNGPSKGGAKARPSGSDDLNASSASRVVLKVPIPTFRRRSSRSPVRGRSFSSSPSRLTSCLVHRDLSASPVIPGKVPSSCSASSLPVRPSLPIYHRRQDDITIPLRECCRACERITEECLSEGEHWQEKFSTEATRRRRTSWGYQCSLRDMRAAGKLSRAPLVPLSTATVVEDGDDSTDLEVDLPCHFSITVDEVDKRRKSLDRSADILNDTLLTPPASPGPFSPTFPYESHRRDVSISSISSCSSNNHGSEESRTVPDMFESRHHLHQHLHQQRLLRSLPIKEEEDEAQLFPLPRRTPSGTPSPKVSPSPSPNASTVCLPATATAGAAASKDSLNSVSRSGSSQESLVKASLSRKSTTASDNNPLPFPRSNIGSVSPRSGSPLAASSCSSASRSSDESVADSTKKDQPLGERRVPSSFASKTGSPSLSASASSRSPTSGSTIKSSVPFPASMSIPFFSQRQR